MRKLHAISIILVFTILITFPFLTIKTEAQSTTVTIRSDGSVYPPTAPIVRRPNTSGPIQYYFSSDMNGPLVIQCQWINVDGANHTLNGGGIQVSATSVEIHNLTIKNCDTGIYVTQNGADEHFYNNLLINNTYGIFLGNTNYMFGHYLINNTIVNCQNAIRLYNAPHVEIEGNTFSYSLSLPSWWPIRSYYSDYITIKRNSIIGRNDSVAIDIDENTVSPTQYHVIEGNLISRFSTGLRMQGNSCSIKSNNFSYSDTGIDFFGSKKNNLTGNYIVSNKIGLKLAASADNQIHYNYFLNNLVQVGTSDQYDAFDDGSHGNYWSNYNGTDSNHDGIGDTPFVISGFNVDRYPFYSIITVPEISTIGILVLLVLVVSTTVALRRKATYRK